MSLSWHYGKELIYWRQYSIEANKSRPPQDQSYTEKTKLAFPAGVLHDGFLHSKDALKNHLKAFHMGRDPFNQNFRKFRSKTQWIGSVQPEKFRKNWSTF